MTQSQSENSMLENNLKELVQKYTHLEDALACEEAENRDLEERLERTEALRHSQVVIGRD